MDSVAARLIGTALLILSVSNCAVDSENTTAKEELDDRRALTESYTPLVGTYRGRVENTDASADPFDVELEVYLVEEQNGLNENGEVRFRPALRGHFIRMDYLVGGLGERNLVLRYYKETGDLSGVTSTSQSPAGGRPESGYLAFVGKFTNGKIEGQFKDHRGILGDVTLNRVGSVSE